MFLRTAAGSFINPDHVVRFVRQPKKEGEVEGAAPPPWLAKMVDGRSAALDDYYTAPGRLEEAIGVIPREERPRRQEQKR